jgi:hypothetical protein
MPQKPQNFVTLGVWSSMFSATNVSYSRMAGRRGSGPTFASAWPAEDHQRVRDDVHRQLLPIVDIVVAPGARGLRRCT